MEYTCSGRRVSACSQRSGGSLLPVARTSCKSHEFLRSQSMQTTYSPQIKHAGPPLLTMRRLILFLSIACASGLTMVTVYNTVIDAASWGSDIPSSIQAARDYFRHVDPR